MNRQRSASQSLVRALFVLTVACFVTTTASFSVCAQENPYSWTNASGKTIEAEFVRMEGDLVVIRKDDREFKIELGKLSDDSQKQAKALASKAPGASKNSSELSLLAAYAFSENGVTKEEASEDLFLNNARFESDGFYSTGQCYSDFLEDFAYIMMQDAGEILAKSDKLSASAFTLAMRIKPASFPGPPKGSMWGGDTGTVIVGGPGGSRGDFHAGGAGWLRLLTKPNGELSLVLRAEQGELSFVELGMSLVPGKWQTVVLGVNAEDKYVEIQIDADKQKVDLSENLDTAILESMIKSDPYFSFQYPIKSTAFHGHVKWLTIFNGVTPSDQEFKLPRDLKWSIQPKSATFGSQADTPGQSHVQLPLNPA